MQSAGCDGSSAIVFQLLVFGGPCPNDTSLSFFCSPFVERQFPDMHKTSVICTRHEASATWVWNSCIARTVKTSSADPLGDASHQRNVRGAGWEPQRGQRSRKGPSLRATQLAPQSVVGEPGKAYLASQWY